MYFEWFDFSKAISSRRTTSTTDLWWRQLGAKYLRSWGHPCKGLTAAAWILHFYPAGLNNLALLISQHIFQVKGKKRKTEHSETKHQSHYLRVLYICSQGVFIAVMYFRCSEVVWCSCEILLTSLDRCGWRKLMKQNLFQWNEEPY